MREERSDHPMVVHKGDESGVAFGTSGRGRLRIYTEWPGETGLALVDGTHPPGQPRIRDHVHNAHDETFVVLEGVYRVRVGDEAVTAEPGEIVFVPRGTAHTFRSVGAAPGRLLNFISPADGADLLRELAEKIPLGLSEDDLVAIHARHGAVLVAALPDWPA